MRLDKFLQEKYKFSRERIQELIKSNKVLINGCVCNKPSKTVSNSIKIEIINDLDYVSRGAYKLKHACETFRINPLNQVVLDIGASTGGFTDYCLKNGASCVFAVDVGTNQLDESLKKNPRVISIEQTNIKDLTIEQISSDISLVVADVSFISLTHVINKISLLFKKKIEILLLIKPQFELDKDYLDKSKGLVISEQKRHQAINKISGFAKNKGYKVQGIIESPIKGKKLGNKEYIIYLK